MDKKQTLKNITKKIKHRKIGKYISSLDRYITLLEKQKFTVDTVNYLYNILSDTGYMLLSGYEPEEELNKKIKALFDNIPETDITITSFIDFPEILFECNRFAEAESTFPDIPNWSEDPEGEELWEDSYYALKESGINIIGKLVDIISVKFAQKKFITGISNKTWKNSWKEFDKKTKDFLLLIQKNIQSFAFIKDDVFELQSQFPKLPKEFEEVNVIKKISHSKANKIEKKNYRRVINKDIIENIYQEYKQKYPENTSIALSYFIKSVLAVETIKSLIINRCFSTLVNEKQKTSVHQKWKLFSSFDEDNILSKNREIPLIATGDKQYSVHITNPGLNIWAVRKDSKASYALPLNKKNLDGAIFCSWKQYPNDSILIRFDSYLKRNSLAELLQVNKKYVEISAEEIFKEDLRSEFLKKATKAVLGLKKQSVPLVDDAKNLISDISKFFISAPDIIQNKIADIIRRTDLKFTNSLHLPKPAMSDTEKINLYIAVDSLAETRFLDPDENNSIGDAIDKAIENNWYYVWICFNPESKTIGHVNGPDEISGDDEEIDLPDNTESVWFFIGPIETLNKIKRTYNNNTAAEFNKKDKLYWFVYGPDK